MYRRRAGKRTVGIDGLNPCHKANASRTAEEQAEMPESPGAYWERLDAYEEEGLEKLKQQTGKRRKKRTKQIKKRRPPNEETRQPDRP